MPLLLQLKHLDLLLVVSNPLHRQLQALLEGEEVLIWVWLLEGEENGVVGFVLGFLRLLLNLRIRESHYWNLFEALLIFTVPLLFKIGVSRLHIFFFVLLDLH